MGRKMTEKQALVAYAITLTVVFLNTIVVWVWPDSSLWALAVVFVLCVLGVTWAYRKFRNETPPTASQDKR